MTSHNDTHRALLAMHDRAYRTTLEIFQSEGFAIPEQGSEGYAWAISVAEAGNPRGQFCAAKLSSAGLFTVTDKSLALRFCEASAQQLFPPALTLLGMFFGSGWGVSSIDTKRAIELFTQAADLGELGALNALACLYLNSKSPVSNLEVGIEFLRAAANAGDAISQFQLGTYLIDTEDPKAETAGIEWLQKSADGGVASAHRLLGHFYRQGQHGVLQNAELAIVHEKKAAIIETNYL